jgi:hypothetical protein
MNKLLFVIGILIVGFFFLINFEYKEGYISNKRNKFTEESNVLELDNSYDWISYPWSSRRWEYSPNNNHYPYY